MKKKLLMIITFFLLSINIVQAKKIIEYDWSFEETNHNIGVGVNSVVVKENNYYTWHIDSYDYINVINQYDETGKLIKTYEPDIENIIVDLIYYDNQFIAIDRQVNIYKLDDNFKIIDKVMNDQETYIVAGMDELKIANNKIYYIDKSNFRIYYTDYALDSIKSINLTELDTLDEVLNKASFISETDKMYFKYINYLYETIENDDEGYEITDIYKKNDTYYVTGYEVKNNNAVGFIRIIDNNLNTIWEDKNESTSITLSLSFYKEYLITIYIAPDGEDQTLRYIKVYDRNLNLLSTEKLPAYEDEIPIAIIPDNTGIVIKSIYEPINEEMQAAINFPDSAIIIDKYIVNIYNIETKTDGNGTITVKDTAVAGDTVSFSTTPNENYIIDKITITDEAGNIVKIENNTFIMPASNVTITATFAIKNPNTVDWIYYVIPLFAFSFGVLLIYLYKKSKKE